jgi:hypothetical protein
MVTSNPAGPANLGLQPTALGAIMTPPRLKRSRE